MEGVVDGNGGRRLLLTELNSIKELVRQLEVHLGGSPELCKHLASQIFTLTERSICLITSASLDGGGAGAGLTSSPLSDATDVPFKTTKKRKTMAAQKHQVRVSSVDDGHSWRKYGQKEILGAKHPRSYYRCTHRRSQGCAATKQVQRADEDPALFDVIYHGEHTCDAGKQPTEHGQDAQSLLQSLGASLTVKTEGLAAAAEPQQVWSATTPFGFPSTPSSGCPAPGRCSPFSAAPSTSQDWGMSPATSDSNLAASYPPPLFEAAAAGDAEWWARSDYEVVSALVAASSAPLDVADEFLDADIDVSTFFV